MDILSRLDAIKAGYKFYFTGLSELGLEVIEIEQAA